MRSKSNKMDKNAQFILSRTYLRDNETWEDVVDRVINFFIKHTRLSGKILKRVVFTLRKHMMNRTALPSGRSLWLAGTPFAEREPAALHSCAYVDIINNNVVDTFTTMMNLLMLGVGVAYRYRTELEVRQALTTTREFDNKFDEYVIPDSREGWVESIRLLLTNPMRKFDYGNIRRKGLPIKGFGGTSSGPKPLIKLHKNIRELLNSTKPNPNLMIDISGCIAACVIAGNVRRSAELTLIPYEHWINDEQVRNSKTLAKESGPQSNRWCSNHSVGLRDSEVTRLNIRKIVRQAMKTAEPGILFLDNMAKDENIDDVGTNPCGEITLEPYELCNLFSIRVDKMDNDILFAAYCYSRVIAELSTGYPLIDAVRKRNRRLGISLTNIASINGFDLDTRHFRIGYKYLKEINDWYAKEFNVVKSNKLTTVKPDGTLSLIMNVAPGIHDNYSEFWIKNVRVSENVYGKVGVEDPNSNGTRIIQLAYKNNTKIKVPHGNKRAELIMQRLRIMNAWVDNQISVSMPPTDNNEKLVDFILENKDWLKSIAFLPRSFDEKLYAYPPLQACTKEEYEEIHQRELPKKLITRKPVAISESLKFCTNDTCAL